MNIPLILIMQAQWQAIAQLLQAKNADDWNACAHWAEKYLEDPALHYAAEVVNTAMERDRHQRNQEVAGGDGDGLLESQRTMITGIGRVWQIAQQQPDCTVRELGAVRDYGYVLGLTLQNHQRIALAVSCTRSVVVSAEISIHTHREEQQLVLVLCSLVYVNYDACAIGRNFSMTVGSTNHVDLHGGNAPLWASRWRVLPSAVLFPGEGFADVVVVQPAGGRIALVPSVVRLQQTVNSLVKRLRLQRILSSTPTEPALSIEDYDDIFDAYEQLVGYGWTETIEPLPPLVMAVVRLIEHNASPSEWQEFWNTQANGLTESL